MLLSDKCEYFLSKYCESFSYFSNKKYISVIGYEVVEHLTILTDALNNWALDCSSVQLQVYNDMCIALIKHTFLPVLLTLINVVNGMQHCFLQQYDLLTTFT